MASILEWILGDGWGEYMKDKGAPWDEYPTVTSFRNRFHVRGG